MYCLKTLTIGFPSLERNSRIAAAGVRQRKTLTKGAETAQMFTTERACVAETPA